MAFVSSEPIDIRIRHNIGGTFDIPTGNIIIGTKGEAIINGGMTSFNFIIGGGNNFKSTILHGLELTFVNRIASQYYEETGYHLYDTEMNIEISRLESLARRYEYLGYDPVADKKWDVTDMARLPGDAWLNEVKTHIRELNKKGKRVTYTALKDHITGKPITRLVPSAIAGDSMSKLEALDTINDLALNKKNDGSMNTIDMRRGRFRDHIINQIPRLSHMGNVYFFFTAHIGPESGLIDKYNRPTKALKYLKAGDTIKGLPKSATYLPHSFWMAHTATELKHPTTKMPEYPSGDGTDMEKDLNIVKMTQLRGKSGKTGYTLNIGVSQLDGWLPTFTEFYNIKVANSYGISGNDRFYHLDIYPDVTLSKSTVRKKISEDPKLARAINITSEWQQLTVYQTRYLHQHNLNFTPEEVYNELIKQGYSWDELFDAREWMAIDNYDKRLKPYLSSIDLLRMTAGIYVPYWFTKEQKSKLKSSSYLKD